MLQGDEIQKNELRWECGMFEGRAQLHIRYWRGKLKERDYFGNQSLIGEGSIIMDVQEMISCDMDWNERGYFRAVVKAVMNIRISKERGIIG